MRRQTRDLDRRPSRGGMAAQAQTQTQSTGGMAQSKESGDGGVRPATHAHKRIMGAAGRRSEAGVGSGAAEVVRGAAAISTCLLPQPSCPVSAGEGGGGTQPTTATLGAREQRQPGPQLPRHRHPAAGEARAPLTATRCVFRPRLSSSSWWPTSTSTIVSGMSSPCSAGAPSNVAAESRRACAAGEQACNNLAERRAPPGAARRRHRWSGSSRRRLCTAAGLRQHMQAPASVR